VATEQPLRSAGTGVFLSTFHKEVPPMLFRYLSQTSALPEKLVILSLLTADVPEVEESRRLEIKDLGQGVYRMTANVGFMETQDVPQLLALARKKGLSVDLDTITYYMGRVTLVPTSKKSISRFRRFLFIFMHRNAINPSVYLCIPPSKVLEIGVQMEF